MYAFTELHNDYPAYVNLSTQPDGTLKLAVRQRGNSGKDYATIILPDAKAEELAEAIFKHVYSADAAPPPASAWSAKPPTEQGEYWHWDGNQDNAPYIFNVMWSGTANKCFVSIGQYGISEAIWCDDFGGAWLKLESPELPDYASIIERATATNTNQPEGAGENQ